MKSKYPVPEELIMIDRHFSWRTAGKVCGWLLLAFAVSALCDVFFAQTVKHWSLEARLTVLTAEFLCLGFWICSMTQWIQKMDELQRRFTLAILLFAVIATFLFFLLWLRLEREGFFHSVFGPPFSKNNTWGIYSVAHVLVLLSGFYGVGYLIFNRRYK